MITVYNPAQYIGAVLKRTKKHHLARSYEMNDWENDVDFLEQLSRKRGRLLPGGEADLDGMAIIVLNDFLRGKIPWFTAPELTSSEEDKKTGVDGRSGRFGEMKQKRKREDLESEPGTSMGALSPTSAAESGKVEEEDEAEAFEGFGSDSAPSYLSDSDEEKDDKDDDDRISLGSMSDEEAEDDGDGDASAAQDDNTKEAVKTTISANGNKAKPKQGPKSKRPRR